VARRGADEVADDPARRGRLGRGPSAASEAWKAASGREPDVWIDEGPVRAEAARAVGRGRGAGRRAPDRGDATAEASTDDPSLQRAVGPAALERFQQRLRDASRAFRKERFEEARKILRPMADRAPTAEAVRELHGLTLYRLGRWKSAAAELEAFRQLTGSTEQHPVLADCYRALGWHGKVGPLWDELRAASPSSELVAEGRIVTAGSLADRGRVEEAIALLEGAKIPPKRPKEHHLRVAYALADLYERAGDVPRARQLFGLVAEHDPELGDVLGRLRNL
jgi:tetratricopeptide (TPR) repeat protein